MEEGTMNEQKFAKYKTAFVAVAALIALLEIPGALDIRNRPFDGYWTDPNDTVIRVFPDSPAQQAGFAEGDRIISSGGIDMKDSKALARRPRAKISETRTYVVERAGQTVNLDLTFSGMPARDVVLSFASAIIGFCFLIFGLWAYLKVQNESTTLLALLGLCLGLAFVNKPYIDSYTARTIYFSVLNVVLIFGLACLLHFMMTFPKAKKILEKKNIMIVLYGPAALVTLFVLFLIVSEPEATSALNTLTNIVIGVFLAGYLGLAAVAMVHSYIKATPQEQTLHGLNFMLLGTVVGLAPVVISAIVGVIAPKVVLPGVEYYGLTMVLIPLSLAYATLKKEKALAPDLA
jgi:hypothetical protein